MKYLPFLFLFLSSFSYGFTHKDKWDDDKSDWTLLMFAIYDFNKPEIEKQIKESTNIEYRIKTSFELDALHVAILCENDFAVNLLLNTNKFKNLDSYFELSCNQENVKIVECFIEQKVKINSPNGSFSNLMSACSNGSFEIVELLLKNNAEINNQREVDGITALMLAALNGEPKIVEILLKYGADKSIKDKNGKTAFDYVNGIYASENVKEETKIKLRELLSL